MGAGRTREADRPIVQLSDVSRFFEEVAETLPVGVLHRLEPGLALDEVEAATAQAMLAPLTGEVALDVWTGALPLTGNVRVELRRTPKRSYREASELLRVVTGNRSYFGDARSFDIHRLARERDDELHLTYHYREFDPEWHTRKVALLLLACSYSEPVMEYLRQPMWRVALTLGAPARKTAVPIAHDCEVTYQLRYGQRSASDREPTAVELTSGWLLARLSRTLERTNRKTRKQLKPKRITRLEERDTMAGITAADRTIDADLHRLSVLDSNAGFSEIDHAESTLPYAFEVLESIARTGRLGDAAGQCDGATTGGRRVSPSCPATTASP